MKDLEVPLAFLKLNGEDEESTPGRHPIQALFVEWYDVINVCLGLLLRVGKLKVTNFASGISVNQMNVALGLPTKEKINIQSLQARNLLIICHTDVKAEIRLCWVLPYRVDLNSGI